MPTAPDQTITPTRKIYPSHVDTPFCFRLAMTAEACASKIVTAMERRERLLIMTPRGKAGRWIKLVAPGLIDKMAQKAIREAK